MPEDDSGAARQRSMVLAVEEESDMYSDASCCVLEKEPIEGRDGAAHIRHVAGKIRRGIAGKMRVSSTLRHATSRCLVAMPLLFRRTAAFA